MVKTSASYKYLRKSPCEANNPVVREPFEILSQFSTGWQEICVLFGNTRGGASLAGRGDHSAADLVELKTVERFTSDIAACAAVTLQFRLSLLDFLTTELGTFI